MKVNEMPPVELLREFFDYDAETGELRWKVSRSRGAKVGYRAGYINKKTGYRVVKIKGINYYEHRVIYALFHNEQLSPEFIIDHANGNTQDNRISNLRKTTHSGNTQSKNAPSNNTSGCVGVSYFKLRKKWRAIIKLNGVQKHLGLFETREEAITARKEAEDLYSFLKRV